MEQTFSWVKAKSSIVGEDEPLLEVGDEVAKIGHRDALAAFEELKEPLCVPLLVVGLGEYGGDLFEALLLGLGCEEVVPVSRLGFSGKGGGDVLLGLGSFQALYSCSLQKGYFDLGEGVDKRIGKKGGSHWWREELASSQEVELGTGVGQNAVHVYETKGIIHIIERIIYIVGSFDFIYLTILHGKYSKSVSSLMIAQDVSSLATNSMKEPQKTASILSKEYWIT